MVGHLQSKKVSSNTQVMTAVLRVQAPARHKWSRPWAIRVNSSSRGPRERPLAQEVLSSGQRAVPSSWATKRNQEVPFLKTFFVQQRCCETRPKKKVEVPAKELQNEAGKKKRLPFLRANYCAPLCLVCWICSEQKQLCTLRFIGTPPAASSCTPKNGFVWVDDSVGFLSVEKRLNHILRTGTSNGTSSVTDIARVGAAVTMPLDHGVAKSSTP